MAPCRRRHGSFLAAARAVSSGPVARKQRRETAGVSTACAAPSLPARLLRHGAFWQNAAGERPGPFTLIKSAQVESGEWVPVDSRFKEHCVSYTAQLEKAGKFVLCIWPEHCLVGTPGHAVQASAAMDPPRAIPWRCGSDPSTDSPLAGSVTSMRTRVRALRVAYVGSATRHCGLQLYLRHRFLKQFRALL